MAESVSFKIDIDSKGANKTVGELRKEFNDLKKAVEETELGTEEYARTVARLGEVRADLKDLKDDMKALDPGDTAAAFANLGQTIAGGFQAASGAALLFAEGNEEVEEAVRKVQAATAIAQGIQAAADVKRQMEMIRLLGLKQAEILQTNLSTAAESKNVVVKGAATVAQRALNAAMNANPVMILVGALIAAAGALALFSSRSEEAKVSQTELNEALAQGIKDNESFRNSMDAGASKNIELAKAQGKSLKEIQDLEKEQHIQRVENIKTAIKENEQLNEAKFKELKTAKEEDKKAIKEEIEGLREKYKTLLEEQYAFNIDSQLIDIRHKAEQKKAEEDEKAAADKKIDEWKKERDRKAEIERDFLKKIRDLRIEQDTWELRRKINNNRAQEDDAIDQINRSALSETQKEELILETRKKFRADRERMYKDDIQADVDKNAQLAQIELEGQQAVDVIKSSYDQKNQTDEEQRISARVERKRAEKEALLSIESSTFDMLGSLATIFSKHSEKFAKLQKFITLRQIASDTASAISSLVKYSQMNPMNSVTSGLAGVAQYASGFAQIISNVAKAKQILSQDGAGSVSAGGGGALSLGGATNFPSGVPVQPLPNQVTGVNTDRQGDFAGFNQQNIKVHVVESEMTETQNSVKTIVNKFTI